MIISSLSDFANRDIGKFAWSELRRFHNISYLYEAHTRLLQVPEKYKKQAMKQVEQIKFCLIQAKEYAAAAESVSLATKPVLLYYSCMSLALAEMLLKQAGDSSLDRARKEHNHHGLVLRIAEDVVRKNEDFGTVASAMMAEPMVRGGGHRSGTFELWHRSARGLPGIGKLNERHSTGGFTLRYHPILLAEDNRLPLIDKAGISLVNAISCVPGMYDVLRSYGQKEEFVRGIIQTTKGEYNNKIWFDLIIYPTTDGNFEKIVDKFKFRLPNVEEFDLSRFGGGGTVRVDFTNASYSNATVPSHCNLNRDDILFWTNDSPQNEFCYIYLSLYILGNFARYYPDLWMKAVEENHPIATVSERFFEIVEARMPLCTLSEMSRSYFLPKF